MNNTSNRKKDDDIYTNATCYSPPHPHTQLHDSSPTDPPPPHTHTHADLPTVVLATPQNLLADRRASSPGALKGMQRREGGGSVLVATAGHNNGFTSGQAGGREREEAAGRGGERNQKQNKTKIKKNIGDMKIVRINPTTATEEGNGD